MRTFIAIETPDNISAILAAIQEQFPKDAKLTLTQKPYHLTLKFLGEVDDNKLVNIKKVLKSIKFKRFSLTLDKLGFFPDENNPRVIWIGFKENKEVDELQNQIDDKLQKLDFPVDKGFHAHITFARLKYVRDKRTFKEKLQKLKIRKIEFKAGSFKLIKSTLTPKGPIYEDIEIFDF